MMLSKALAYCLTEDDPQSYAQIFESLQTDSHDEELRQLQIQKDAFLHHVRNPHQSLEDHQNGVLCDAPKSQQTNKPVHVSMILSNLSHEMVFMKEDEDFEEVNYTLNVISQSQFRSLQKSEKKLLEPRLATLNGSSTKFELNSTINKSKLTLRNRSASKGKIEICDDSPYTNSWVKNVLHRYYNVRIKSASKTLGSQSYSMASTSATKPKCRPKTGQFKGRSDSFSGQNTCNRSSPDRNSDINMNNELELLRKNRIKVISNRSYVSRINSHLKVKQYNHPKYHSERYNAVHNQENLHEAEIKYLDFLQTSRHPDLLEFQQDLSQVEF